MSLNDEQKDFLFNLIKKFMSAVLPYLSDEDKKMLSKPFLHFLSSNGSNDFDQFYKRYIKRKKNRKKVYLFFINFVPLRNLRKQFRHNIG